MMVKEINPKISAFIAFVNRERIIGALIVLVVICISISWIANDRSARAIDKANEAIAMATTWQQMYKETERECRLAQNDVQALQMDLVEAGIPQTHGKKQ